MACQICDGKTVETVAFAADWLALLPAGRDERREILERAGRAGWAAEFRFVRCAGCDLIRIDPMPEGPLLNRYYAQYHATEKYAAKGTKKIARALRRINRLRRTASGRAFIDVGCNVGFAVEAARRAGFTAIGIDIDPEAVALARQSFPQAAFHATDIAAFAATGQQFDVIYCAEVIEHVPALRPFVAALATMSAPGGLLYLTTPDAGHIRVRNRFLTWREVKPPEHLCWYSKSNLRRLFEASGFRVERFRPNLKPGIRMLARRLPDGAAY